MERERLEGEDPRRLGGWDDGKDVASRYDEVYMDVGALLNDRGMCIGRQEEEEKKAKHLEVAASEKANIDVTLRVFMNISEKASNDSKQSMCGETVVVIGMSKCFFR